MYLFKNAPALRQYLARFRTKNRRIGFVPTMGALHAGHLSLIRQSLDATQCTVCSIFVNPTQFNEASDLLKYPRTPARDLEMLHKVGCHAVFMPPVEEIYPEGMDTGVNIDFDSLSQPMEGRFRPGHFEGVAQVVKRLLDIVEPSLLFMGQKDYQQFLVVRHMLETLSIPTEAIMSPTVREKDGLAMSSRNQRLSAEQRAQAPAIYRSLKKAARLMKKHTPRQVAEKAIAELQESGLKPEYFEIVNGRTLQPVETFKATGPIVACVAAWAGEVRLIDNIVLKS